MPSKYTPSRSEITIRPAVPGDADFILSLAPRFVAFELPKGRRKRETAAAIRADLQHALQESPSDMHLFFVSEDDASQRTGFIHLKFQRDFFSNIRTCHISDVAVAPGCEGHGIGHALLAHAEIWARTHGCGWLTLAVFPGNTRARALYDRCGFEPDLLRMAKPLHG